MVSDAERREVARRLREAASYYEMMERDVDFYPVESALGLKPAGETAYAPESVRSLADLIEPPLQCPYYDSRKHWCSIHDVPTIGRDALLALADEMERNADTLGSDYGVAVHVLRKHAEAVRRAVGA